MTAVLELLGRARVLPILRTQTADAAVDATGRLVTAGVELIELTATTPGWDEALAAARAQHPSAVIGMGTITDAATAERALASGAAFLVSPWAAPDVRAVAESAGVLFLEGALTPGELAAASARGPAKLFPAHTGGPQYLRSVLAVLPGRTIVPTGGVRLADVGRWLEAGAYAVGVGSELLAAEDIGAAMKAAVGA